MTKGKLLFLLFIIESIIFAVTLRLNLLGINLFNFWFSLSLFFIGIYSIIYSNLYKLDSTFYLGVLLISFAFFTAYRQIMFASFNSFYPYYIFCFAIAHLAVYFKFRQNIHVKIFAILILEVILLLSYKMNFIQFATLAILNSLFLINILVNVTARARKNFRSSK